MAQKVLTLSAGGTVTEAANAGELGYTPVNKAGDTGIGILALSANAAAPSLQIGGLGLQSFASNNQWIADNIYYNSGWKYIGNGWGSQIYFDSSNTGLSFIVFANNVSGAGAAATPLTAMSLAKTTGAATFASTIGQTPVAFASLPAGVTGMRAFVNNNSAGAAFGSAANGSGAVTYPVYHDGTSWKVG